MEFLISLSFPIPLVLFIWIEVVVYRNYLKAVADNPDKQTRSTLFWAAKSLLGALPPYLLTILIASLVRAFLSNSNEYWNLMSYRSGITTFFGLSLALGIPLGLLWGVSRGAYRNYQKSNIENPYKTLAPIAIMLFKIFLVLLSVLLLIEAILFQGVGFEILGYLALGWMPILFEQVSQLFQYWEAGSIAILVLFAFHGFMRWRKNVWKVRWTAGLAGVVFLVFLSGYAFIGATRHTAGVIQEPIVHYQSGRAYDSDTKSNLHNLYLACKAYWADHGGVKSCNREIASGTSYGYLQSQDVRIAGRGGEEEFRALATNINNNKWFWMDQQGAIQPITPSKEKS
jgi:hypothetical protein